MSTKTISLKVEAYQRLRSARRYAEESFSEVVLRATWPEDTVSARAFLGHLRKRALRFTDDELAQVEALKEKAGPPGDKWATR